MLYDALKTLHILSAAGLVTAISQLGYQWLKFYSSEAPQHVVSHAQNQTLLLIVPFALFQLMTGFAMIGLQKVPVPPFWVKASVGFFLLMLISWLGFILMLLHPKRKRLQGVLLLICITALLSLLFFMTNFL